MRRLTLILVLCLHLFADDKYQLGEGFQVGSLPLYFGGYFSTEYSNSKDLSRYSVDDIAFLGYGGYDKFSYLIELEFKEFYVKSWQNDLSQTTQDHKLYLERVYLDYNVDENYQFRFGKYNSPIGFWNLLPINVLRETTSSPVSTEIIFPRFTTGVDATYSHYATDTLKVDLMLQHNDGLDETYNNYNTDRHYALGLSYEKNDLTLKVNGGYFHRDDHPDNQVLDSADLYYLLLSAKYEADDYQLMAELGSQHSNDTFTTPYAGYFQGVYRLTPRHIAVARVESYNDKRADEADDIMIFGYTYRPLYPIALKAEYQFHSLNGRDQFLCSFSMMF